MSVVKYDLDNIKDDYVRRLADEHLRLEKLAKLNKDKLSYEVTDRSRLKPYPPIAYNILYKLNSIVAVDESGNPQFGKDHRLQIRLSNNYPEQSAECKMVSPVWHPNIKSEGPFQGDICTNHDGFGSLFFLDELIIRIGELLQYRKYMAEDRPPWPDDQKVARWVREIAEPRKIVNLMEAICLDDRRWISIDEVQEISEEDIVITLREEDGEPEQMQGESEKTAEDDEISFLDL